MAALGNNSEMRMRYCASEIGDVLTVVNATTPTFTLNAAYDGSVDGDEGATLAATRTKMAGVDPTITSVS